MSLFNWIFWKKAAFTSGVIGLSLTPLALINRYSSGLGNSEMSSYKKNMEYLSGNYAKKFGIQMMAKEMFGIQEMKSGIEDVFAEDLALLAVEKSTLFQKKYEGYVKDEKSEYEKELSSSKGKVFDSKGGSRASMKRRVLTEKAYADFKKEILEFDQNNFIFNRNAEAGDPVRYGAHLSATEINKPDNWKKIGFFSRGEGKGSFDASFAKHKFEFINFAHKTWFQEAKPFYVWMSLWKHKENPSAQELKTFWDVDKLKEKQVHVNQASYAFPYFDNKSSSLSTTRKFKNFFKNVVKEHGASSKVYIPKGYTEDSATSILVEGNNMYSNLYVRFAAAANHKYQEKLQEKKTNSSGSSAKQFINQRDKNENVETYKQPTELFMFQSSNSEGVKARVKVNKDMFEGSTYDSKNEIADLVEIKDTPWMFIRNRAGIHAMAVDVENMESSQKDVYGYFQYRTFQVLYKDLLSFKQTLDVRVDKVIDSFKDYFTNHFNRILLKYVYSKEDQNTFFGFQMPKEIVDFKSTFVKSEEMNEARNKYLSKLKLREALINTYVQTKWEVNTSTNKFDYADITKGLVGMIPWEMKTDDPENDKENYLFEELEKLYDFDLFKDDNNLTAVKRLSEDYGEKVKAYKTESDKFVDKLGLMLDVSASGSTSDRVFSNNYYVNRINDKMLDKPEIFNEFLFKYIIKSDYLGKSVLGNKGLVDTESGFGISLPKDLQSNGSAGSGEAAGAGSTVIDKINDVSNPDENIKKVFGKIEDQITTNYYSRLLLEKELSNPWAVAKYGGNVLKKEENKMKENLHKISKQSFADRFSFGESDFRRKHYAFLTTLSYLVADNFENLLKYLRSVISHKSDSYIVFSKYSLSKNEVTLGNDSLQNPFLNRQWDVNQELNKSVGNIYKYFSQINFRDSDNKVDSEFVYGGFYTDALTTNVDIPSKYKPKFESDKLYRYGKTKSDFNTYVLSISSEEEFKRVVERIKNATKNESDKSWVDNLSKDQIYVTSSSGISTKTLKILTLQEKKNLLSAYLNDVKVEINSDSIEKDKFKSVFLTDPDNSYNSTNSQHSSGSETKLKEDLLKEYSDIKEGADKIFTLFQINSNDVESFDKFKTYVNGKLSSDVFWAWVIDLALMSSVQELAMQDLSSKSEKIEVFDAKWASAAQDKFVRK